MSKSKSMPTQSHYISPNELAHRWQCSRSSVDRIARRNGMTRVCLGKGRSGMVRYIREEVEKLETQRRA